LAAGLEVAAQPQPQQDAAVMLHTAVAAAEAVVALAQERLAMVVTAVMGL
jgi:hypothetical protein